MGLMVHIEALQEDFKFAVGEKIFMEISQKYDQAQIENLAGEAGFEVQQAFYDSCHWFTDQIWVPQKVMAARAFLRS